MNQRRGHGQPADILSSSYFGIITINLSTPGRLIHLAELAIGRWTTPLKYWPRILSEGHWPPGTMIQNGTLTKVRQASMLSKILRNMLSKISRGLSIPATRRQLSMGASGRMMLGPELATLPGGWCSASRVLRETITEIILGGLPAELPVLPPIMPLHAVGLERCIISKKTIKWWHQRNNDLNSI
jgi:hypothetical protein